MLFNRKPHTPNPAKLDTGPIDRLVAANDEMNTDMIACAQSASRYGERLAELKAWLEGLPLGVAEHMTPLRIHETA